MLDHVDPQDPERACWQPAAADPDRHLSEYTNPQYANGASRPAAFMVGSSTMKSASL
jgi:hypothetical protein